MADENTSAAPQEGAPAPAEKPAQTEPAVKAAPAPAKPAEPIADPRIAELEAQLAAMRASVEAEKAAAAKREETHAAEIAKASAAAKAASDLVMADLPESVRKAVQSIAGDDPQRRSETIAALRANGLAVAPVGTLANTLPAQPEARATPTTAASAETSRDADILKQYQALRSGGAPVAAAALYASHSAEIDRAMKAHTN